MSIHKECGEEIIWVARDDEPGRYHPPLDYMGQVYVVVDDKLIRTTGYKSHKCDPDKVEAWMAYLQRMEQVKSSQPDLLEAPGLWAASRAKRKEEAWATALAWSCPTCEAPPGSYCINLSKRFKGQNVETTNPHPARLEREQPSG